MTRWSARCVTCCKNDFAAAVGLTARDIAVRRVDSTGMPAAAKARAREVV
jgi:hypothetical protein